MKVLVIGGTDFVGSVVVCQSIEKGHSVTVFDRSETKTDSRKEVK